MRGSGVRVSPAAPSPVRGDDGLQACLAREGRLHGPAMASECLVSKGYTNAEKAFATNYAPGDVVAFHRPYKRVGVEKGDECRVIGVDHKAREVLLEDGAMRPLGAWAAAIPHHCEPRICSAVSVGCRGRNALRRSMTLGRRAPKLIMEIRWSANGKRRQRRRRGRRSPVTTGRPAPARLAGGVPPARYLTVKRLPRKRRSSRRQSKVRRLSPR